MRRRTGSWTTELAILFVGFRLIYIPASVLSHSGHGLPWLTAALGLALTFGLEALTRRRGGAPTPGEQWRGRAATVVGLLLLGLFPEEAPIALILWAGIGAAWGAAVRDRPIFMGRPVAWGLLAAGAALGATGLLGPGSWLMALVLVLDLLLLRNGGGGG